MGIYLNPGNTRYQMAVNSEIFIDKSKMISYLNSVVNTNQRFVSVSRPRRFGKTMAADMVCAYYDHEAESRPLFEKCQLSKSDNLNTSWDCYLGKFDVIRLVMTDFMENSDSIDDMLEYLTEEVTSELQEEYSDVRYGKRVSVRTVMNKIYGSKQTQFVIVIDEWDAVFREYKDDKEGQKKYLDFLRDWLKDKEYIALAYMTGILPIKKYGKHSALNMFDEYSMTSPMFLAPYAGFTEDEVALLAKKYGRDFKQIKTWYDGYRVSDVVPPDPDHEQLLKTGKSPEARKYSLYSPLSVVKAMRTGVIDNYWNETETYEALQQYVDWNFDGLKEDIVILMDGGRVAVDITGYQNDMTTFHSKDDILTMFIHLGYLGYDRDTKEVFIPNQEVLQVFKSSTKSRGYADLAFIPKNTDKPALLIELKYDKNAETAIAQIHRQKYPDRLSHYKGNLILVGINYDKEIKNDQPMFKHHSCKIERA